MISDRGWNFKCGDQHRPNWGHLNKDLEEVNKWTTWVSERRMCREDEVASVSALTQKRVSHALGWTRRPLRPLQSRREGSRRWVRKVEKAQMVQGSGSPSEDVALPWVRWRSGKAEQGPERDSHFKGTHWVHHRAGGKCGRRKSKLEVVVMIHIRDKSWLSDSRGGCEKLVRFG